MSPGEPGMRGDAARGTDRGCVRTVESRRWWNARRHGRQNSVDERIACAGTPATHATPSVGGGAQQIRYTNHWVGHGSPLRAVRGRGGRGEGDDRDRRSLAPQRSGCCGTHARACGTCQVCRDLRSSARSPRLRFPQWIPARYVGPPPARSAQTRTARRSAGAVPDPAGTELGPGAAASSGGARVSNVPGDGVQLRH